MKGNNTIFLQNKKAGNIEALDCILLKKTRTVSEFITEECWKFSSTYPMAGGVLTKKVAPKKHRFAHHNYNLMIKQLTWVTQLTKQEPWSVFRRT